jgi:hypothetical protein
MRRSILTATLALAVPGRATAPPPASDLTAIRGTAPTHEQAAQIIRETLARALKDTDSLQLQELRIASGPTPFTWSRKLIEGGGYDTAWLWCFEYSVKDSDGYSVGLTVDGLTLRTRSNGEVYVVPMGDSVHRAACGRRLPQNGH